MHAVTCGVLQNNFAAVQELQGASPSLMRKVLGGIGLMLSWFELFSVCEASAWTLSAVAASLKSHNDLFGCFAQLLYQTVT